MTMPHSQEYNEAIQSPESCFHDPELRAGQPVANALGLPMPRSGNFADVYEFVGASGTKWAVKCFTREVAGLKERYAEISKHLAGARLPFTVDFSFVEQGIRVRGQWYPVLKMQWVEGFLLNEFVRNSLKKPSHIEALAQIWVRVATRLSDAHMAHADLQHGNVLLVPGRQEGSLAVKLIDYDGMWVPALANKNSGELGHPAYQHPHRLKQAAYCADVDHLPHLTISCALRGLLVAGRPLWDRFDNGDNLLFRQSDLQNPAASPLIKELWNVKDAVTHDLTGNLVIGLCGSLGNVPRLQNLFDGEQLRPLTTEQERFVSGIVGAGAVIQRPPPIPVVVPIATAISDVPMVTAAPPVRASSRNDSQTAAGAQAPGWVVGMASAGMALVVLLSCIGVFGAAWIWWKRLEPPHQAEAGKMDAPIPPGDAKESPDFHKQDALDANDPLDQKQKAASKRYPYWMKQDQVYRIEMKSAHFVTYVRVENAAGVMISEVPGQPDSEQTITAPHSGEFFIICSSAMGSRSGSYTLLVKKGQDAARDVNEEVINDFVGSTWVGKIFAENDRVRFDPKATLLFVTDNTRRGSWNLTGRHLYFETNNGFIAFRGLVKGKDQVEGALWNKLGDRWPTILRRETAVKVMVEPAVEPPKAVSKAIELPEFSTRITKIANGMISFQDTQKGKLSGNERTVPLSSNAIVAQFKLPVSGGSYPRGAYIENGLQHPIFTNIQSKGLFARITMEDSKVTKLLLNPYDLNPFGIELTAGEAESGAKYSILTSAPAYAFKKMKHEHRMLFLFPMLAGNIYQIDMVKLSPTLDPYLYVEDPNGNVIREDDNSGGNKNARITLTATKSGKHRIIATHVGNLTFSRPFTLTIRQDNPPSPKKKT